MTGNILERVKNWFSREMESTVDRLPPSVADTVKNEKFKLGFWVVLILCTAYFLNVKVLDQRNAAEKKLQSEERKGKEAEAREKALEGMLKDLAEKSANDEEKFNELRKQLFAVEFNDPLEVEEYIQEAMNSHGIYVDSISEIRAVEDMAAAEQEKKEAAPAKTAGKTAVKPEAQKAPEETAAIEDSSKKIQIGYNMKSSYDQIKNFFSTIEGSDAFLEFRNSPVVLQLMENGLVKTNFTVNAYSEKLSMTGDGKEEYYGEETPYARKKLLGKLNDVSLRSLVKNVKVTKLRGRLYGMAELSDGRSLVLEDGSSFLLPGMTHEKNRRYWVDIQEREYGYIVYLKDKENSENLVYGVDK